MKQIYTRFIIPILFFVPVTVLAQNPIKGIVKHTNGTPIPHASVKIRGTNIAVSADEYGKFSIQSQQEPPFFLQVSSVGYKAQDF